MAATTNRVFLSRAGLVCLAAAAVVSCAEDYGGGNPVSEFTTWGSQADAGVDNPDVTLSPGSDTTLGCSVDLQNVVDSHGHVVTACAPALGCANGKCVPPCDAAAADKGSLGCNFMAPTPDFENELAQPCFAVFIANTWPRDVKLTVSLGARALDVTTFARIPKDGRPESEWPLVPATGIPQGEVAVLFLSSDPSAAFLHMSCPVSDAAGAATAIGRTGRGQAFHIEADAPVSAYDIHPYGGSSSFLPSAELLFPTTSWGTNYVAALPKQGDYSDQGRANGPQWAQIVGAVDHTTVRIVPKVALPAGAGLPASPANAVATFTVNAGEILQWQDAWTPTSGAPFELSGSVVSSDQPIAFIGGNGYLCLKSSTNVSQAGTFGGCDSGHQMLPPVSALGWEYAIAPYATRRADLAEESILYRVVGTVDGTQITFDPPYVGAPLALGSGSVVDFEATGAFVLKSQGATHPFHVAQMMTGGFVMSGSRPGVSPGDAVDPGALRALGDEEYVNAVAPAQYLKKYVFFTDPAYATTNLVITRRKNEKGSFADVMVDCLGVVNGFRPLGTSGEYESTNVDLVRYGTPTGCTNGGHVATSDGPFGIVVWGLDSFASYAYPAGGNLAQINSIVVPPTPR